MKLKTNIKLWASCLNAINKVGQATAGIPSLASSPISKIIGLPGTAVNPILGIICHMLIMLQPIKFLFLFVYN